MEVRLGKTILGEIRKLARNQRLNHKAENE
jgi:hypothetical protein